MFSRGKTRILVGTDMTARVSQGADRFVKAVPGGTVCLLGGSRITAIVFNGSFLFFNRFATIPLPSFSFLQDSWTPPGPWAEAFGDEARVFLKACRRKATDFDIGPGITFTIVEVGCPF